MLAKQLAARTTLAVLNLCDPLHDKQVIAEKCPIVLLRLIFINFTDESTVQLNTLYWLTGNQSVLVLSDL
jgi:hypothetical protein